MTPARKRRIWEASGGVCGCDNPECRKPVPMTGPGVRYDHRIPFFLRPDLDDWPNLRPVLTACDKVKTYGQDIPRIAKTKRQAKMRVDVPRPPSKMKSGGKLAGGRKLPGKGQGRKLQGRGFRK